MSFEHNIYSFLEKEAGFFITRALELIFILLATFMPLSSPCLVMASFRLRLIVGKSCSRNILFMADCSDEITKKNPPSSKHTCTYNSEKNTN